MQAAIRRPKHSQSFDTHGQSTKVSEVVSESRALSDIDHHSSCGVASPPPAPGKRAELALPPLDECLGSEQLIAFVEGQLDSGGLSRVDAHMSACPSCSARVIEVLSMRRQASLSFPDPRGTCLSFDLGTCLGERYLIYRSLGRGGMGEVYEALDVELLRPVALKTSGASTCDSPEALRRLANEFDLAQRVRHPNVRRVHELGVHEVARSCGSSFPFISMQLIEGESLAKKVCPGCVDLATFAWIASELLGGLAAIHGAGIIHRDIKSQNVLVCDAPRSLAIIDFGLAIEARCIDRDFRANTARAQPFEGSPAYMAPEQLVGAAVSFASDIFSCGVVLFQLLTGKLPFPSLSGRRRASARRNPHEVPHRVGAMAPDLPAWVDQFVRRCLEVDPGARYANAAEALEALERWLALT